MCSGKRDLVRRGGRLRVRAQIEDRAEDIPYMQPCRACLAQYLDDVCDFEEADGRGELALARHRTSDRDERISPNEGDRDTHPQQLLHQPGPWLVHSCGKLCARGDDAHCRGDDGWIALQCFSEFFFWGVLRGMVVWLVERRKLHRAARRPLAVNAFDIVNRGAYDGVECSKSGEGHGASSRREFFIWGGISLDRFISHSKDIGDRIRERTAR